MDYYDFMENNEQTDYNNKGCEHTGFEQTNSFSDPKNVTNRNVNPNARRRSHNIFSIFSRRNPIVNAYFILYVLILIVAIQCPLLFDLALCIGDIKGVLVYLSDLYYILFFCYFSYQFIFKNKRSAFFPMWLGSTAVTFIVAYIISVILDEGYLMRTMTFVDEISSRLLILILSVILNLFCCGVTFAIMQIKKYGISAWNILSTLRGKRPLKENVGLWAFFTIWIIPMLVLAIDYNALSFSFSPVLKDIKANIGDYYYDDGTISSEYLPDKKAIGVVFSLETSDTDKSMGYKHGQIVALNDAVSYKTPWDKGEPMDYPRYPNYTWDNRLDALKDIDGRGYKKCDNTYCLDINLRCDDYLNGSVQGISDWYLPTAGQWTKIIENLGDTKVDRMLKFDSATASQNLEKLNINPQRWYWTITEFDAENAWSIRLANGEFGSRSNKQNGAYLRPVASF